MWPASGACTVGLFEYLSTLMLICAQSGMVLGRERKTDPASSARSCRKGLKDNYYRLLGIVSNFCIPFGTEIKISISGGSTVTALKRPSTELRIFELSTLIPILNKPEGV